MFSTPIQEEFIYYLWQTKNFDLTELTTQKGENLEILSWGIRNQDSGPDFTMARIKIDGVVWAGNIEMHVLSSDWNRHQHQNDPAYSNVILHVVFEHNQEIYTSEGLCLPVLELKNRISKKVFENYKHLRCQTTEIPCEKFIQSVNVEKINVWKDRLMVQRLERKTLELNRYYHELNGDWDELCYRLVFKYLGGKVNAEACFRLSCSTPLKILQKNLNNPLIIEALLFGQAGLLNADFNDSYFQNLKKEYLYQKKKYRLTAMNPVHWKFSKMTPAGFPSIRIAQMAGLILKNNAFLSFFQSHSYINEYYDFFDVQVHEYWNHHYRFGGECSMTSRKLGKDIIHIILINAVCPILFFYGLETGAEAYKQKAIALLEQIPSENNKITRKFKSLGISSQRASDSQSLIELKTQYCDMKNCLQCSIGHTILMS